MQISKTSFIFFAAQHIQLYNDTNICYNSAKVRLLDDVRDMNLSSKHPCTKHPRRRDGDCRLLREVDDLLSFDEQKVMDRLQK